MNLILHLLPDIPGHQYIHINGLLWVLEDTWVIFFSCVIRGRFWLLQIQLLTWGRDGWWWDPEQSRAELFLSPEPLGWACWVPSRQPAWYFLWSFSWIRYSSSLPVPNCCLVLMCPLNPLPSSSTVVVKPVLVCAGVFKLWEKFNPLFPLKSGGCLHLNLSMALGIPALQSLQAKPEPKAAPDPLPSARCREIS